MKVRIKKEKQSKVKNGGMDFLGTFVGIGQDVEVEVKDVKAAVKLKQFQFWFDLVEGEVEEPQEPKRDPEDILLEIQAVEEKLEVLEERDELLESKLGELEQELKEAEQ